jgi:hypothetical protein
MKPGIRTALLDAGAARWNAALPTLVRFGQTIVAGHEALKEDMATLVKDAT